MNYTLTSNFYANIIQLVLYLVPAELWSGLSQQCQRWLAAAAYAVLYDSVGCAVWPVCCVCCVFCMCCVCGAVCAVCAVCAVLCCVMSVLCCMCCACCCCLCFAVCALRAVLCDQCCFSDQTSNLEVTPIRSSKWRSHNSSRQLLRNLSINSCPYRVFLAVQRRVWQLNRWPCHWVTHWVSQSVSHFVTFWFRTYRVTL